MLNLKENELDVQAELMGSDVRVHREFYRLPQNTINVSSSVCLNCFIGESICSLYVLHSDMNLIKNIYV